MIIVLAGVNGAGKSSIGGSALRAKGLDWYNPETGVQTVSDEELHGTYDLESIGSNASHGCVRLTNESIEWLYQNLAIGDLVVIRK